MADFNSLKSFLAAYAPEELNRLRSSHPDHSIFFEPLGVAMGESAAVGEATSLAVLSQVSIVVAAAIDWASNRLRNAHRLDLAGGIAGLLSSGGAVGAISQQYHGTGLALASVAFFANAVPLVAPWLRSTPTGNGQLTEYLSKLLAGESRARQLQREFARKPEMRDEKKSDDALVREAENLAEELFTVLRAINYPIASDAG